MRVGFINYITGTVMEVDESRVEEYLAAGYKPVADSAPCDPEPAKEQKKRSKKK